MDKWDSDYIHGKFQEINDRLNNLQEAISRQSQIFERKLENLSKQIAKLQPQDKNGKVKTIAISGTVGGAIVEIANLIMQ